MSVWSTISDILLTFLFWFSFKTGPLHCSGSPQGQIFSASALKQASEGLSRLLKGMDRSQTSLGLANLEEECSALAARLQVLGIGDEK